ncbi:MAG: glycosyltransferase [Coriobacteriia bacterium]
MTLSVLTWHVHGSYLGYLAECGHDFCVPVLPGRPARFGGRPPDADWPDNVREIPAEEIAGERFDCILYQHHDNWLHDRGWLSAEQLELPQAYLEHDPPREHPTDTRHPVDDPRVVIVHVTHFNQLMWDCGASPTVVIEHGVKVPDEAVWTGDLPRGITVVNNLTLRGRRLGADVFEHARGELPIDLFGMGSQAADGFGELTHRELPLLMRRYRFFFNPIRYTSLGLAVCEAMAVGVPIVGLATTEMASAIENGVSGFVHTDISRVIATARSLLEDDDLAAQMSQGARRIARERFGIERFANDWNRFLSDLSAGKLEAATCADMLSSA